MELADIITPDRVFDDVAGGSKKKVLETAAGLIARQVPELNALDLFDSLISREKLGSTGLGKGVALPHCRAKHCQRAIGSFIKLSAPVDFDSIDHLPVDLLFVLLVPEDADKEHLEILSKVAALFNDDQRCQSLRGSGDDDKIFDLLVTPA